MCLRFSKVGRITGAQDTHSQDQAYIRFGTEELQCLTKTNLVILRISPLYFRVKPRLCQHAVSAMGRHVAGGGGDSKYLGKVHRILLILRFISFGKEKVLSYRIYSGYMVACELQTYYLLSLLSLQKTNFCREATTKNMSVVHRLDIWKNALFVFFLLLIR